MKLTLPAASQLARFGSLPPSGTASGATLRATTATAALAAAMALAGCSAPTSLREYVPQIVTPYRIDIQQGNFVTLDMVEKLQTGQTREQVRFILGTPMLTDVFHADRWDYVFRSAKGWNDPEKRRLTVFFDKGEKLAKWEAIAVPPPVDLTGGAGTAGASVSAATLQPLPSPGLIGRLFGTTSAKPSTPPAASVTPATASAAAIVSPAGTVAGVGNLVLAGSAPPTVVPAAPAPTPAAAPSAATSEEKRGIVGRVFGWLSPSAPTASTAASAATTAAAAASAATAAMAATTARAAAAAPPSASAVAVAPAVASATPVPTPAAASQPASAPPAPAAPAATLPLVTPGPPPQTAAILSTITESVEQWRTAWSGRNLADYLAAYAPDFKPAGITRARWEAQRKERLAKPVFIFVNVFEPQITINSGNTATVVFTQQYETEALKETGRKTLVFGNVNGKWLIREESFSAK